MSVPILIEFKIWLLDMFIVALRITRRIKGLDKHLQTLYIFETIKFKYSFHR